jgi:hypothetical protein
MAKRKSYSIVLAKPVLFRYQREVLSYLVKHFSIERAIEIDENIRAEISTLTHYPNRGKIEESLKASTRVIRFILYKETKHFQLKILYYVDEMSQSVYITDIFPTEMNPSKLKLRN